MEPARRDLPTVRVDRRHSSINSSQTHPGDIQCPRGSAIQTGSNPDHRMEVTPGGLSMGVQSTVDTELGPLRDQVQQPVASVRESSTGSSSTRTRRSRHQLGGTGRLRVSTDHTDTKSTAAIQTVSLPSTAHRAKVAEPSVVSRPAASSRSRSTATARLGQPFDSSTIEATPSQPPDAPAARVDLISAGLRGRGFSASATQAILRAHRPSTTSAYNVRWLCFQRWCARKKLRPQTVRLERVAEFLLHLRNSRNLKGSTIATYISVIATVRDPATGTKLASFPELIAMIKGFKQEDQVQKFRPPKWNLNIVLLALTRTPYEPLRDAPLHALTRKTAFLLGFATAARMSELHALDVDMVRFQRKEEAVHLGLLMNFVAKNQLPHQAPRTFTVRALSSVLGRDDVEDLSLCPVRALRHYVDRTKSFRCGRKRLFLSCNSKRHKDITKNTVSMWIRATILHAYEDDGLSPPRASNPHELRAMAATMSLHCNTALTDILTGCFWSTDTVFADHYLRDVSTEDVEGFHQLGPVVAAQTLINRRRPRRR